MVDIISLVIGFAIGLVVFAIAVEFGLKKSTSTPPASKHTKSWSISEISNPRIMAEYLSNVDLPQGSKVLVNKYKDKEKLAGFDVKEHKGIRGNFIIGDDRALILSGPIKENEIGIWTVEKDIVQELNREFKEMWNEASKMEWDET